MPTLMLNGQGKDSQQRAEWEFAALGGRSSAVFVWGEEDFLKHNLKQISGKGISRIKVQKKADTWEPRQ